MSKAKERRYKELSDMLQTGKIPVYGCAKTWEAAFLLGKDVKTIRNMVHDGRLKNMALPGEHMATPWKQIRQRLGL